MANTLDLRKCEMVDRTVSELLIDQGHPSRIGKSVIISPDCTRVAYVARAGRKQLVVVDGREANYYDAVERRSLSFCSDSKRLAFVARAEKRRFVVVIGRPNDPARRSVCSTPNI